MGAGKSTVARSLGQRLGWRVEDIDEGVEALERRSISTIFSQSGEPYFRRVERDVLGTLLSERDIVVATGGGTFVDPDNRAAMLASGAVVWLDVPFQHVVSRLPPDGRRPLAHDRLQLEQMFESRQLAYQHAHVRVDASRPVDDIVERLLLWIGY
jgi:shikimate kinase